MGERGTGGHAGIALICPKPLNPSPEGEGIFNAKGIEGLSSFLKNKKYVSAKRQNFLYCQKSASGGGMVG
ncbi:hypothetical protein MASR2M15_03200 [Anaerolineales bacterium]